MDVPLTAYHSGVISFVRIDNNAGCKYVQRMDSPIRRNDERNNYGTDAGAAPERTQNERSTPARGCLGKGTMRMRHGIKRGSRDYGGKSRRWRDGDYGRHACNDLGWRIAA